ncbi:MAG: hypothetical protein QOG94_2029 [Solirubrobacteraceae bacterium]|nr:hypothetical protein [Solirubrobacteraceae bacterium]
MRIVWAIPCGWARPSSTPGRLDLFDCQIDSVLLGFLGTEVEFDVAFRLAGSAADFAVEHVVQVTLSDPQLNELGALDLPVFPRVPAPFRLPGYELSAHDVARISFRPDREGGYDLSFALDGEPDHRNKATIAVKLLASG